MAFPNLFFFNWRIIALQCCVGFWHTSTWVSHWYFSSFLFSRSVMSDSLQPHEPQYARPESTQTQCPLCWWCHPTISSSVVPFSSCPQTFPASGSFPMSQPSASGGQSIGVSALTSVPPMNTQDWSPLGWTGWISLQSRYFKPVTKNKHVPKSNQHHSLKMVRMKYGFLETRAGRYLGKGIREASETFPIL